RIPRSDQPSPSVHGGEIAARHLTHSASDTVEGAADIHLARVRGKRIDGSLRARVPRRNRLALQVQGREVLPGRTRHAGEAAADIEHLVACLEHLYRSVRAQVDRDYPPIPSIDRGKVRSGLPADPGEIATHVDRAPRD